MDTPELKLVSHVLCPYVQRARIVLAEKNLPYEIEFIDLANKPEWFLKLSPTGKTPLLLANGRALFESSVIAEYLDEISPGSLHPADPMQRARHRAWMEFGSGILANIAALYSAPTAAEYLQHRDTLVEKFGKVEAELGSGPFFAGTSFSIVDAVYGPVFRYFDVFDLYQDFDFLAGLPRLRAWRTALRERPAVKNAVLRNYPVLLHQFILKRGSWMSQLAAKRRAA